MSFPIFLYAQHEIEEPKKLISIEKDEELLFYCLLHIEGDEQEEIICFPGDHNDPLHIETGKIATWNALAGVNDFQPVSMSVTIAVKNQRLETFKVSWASMPDLPAPLQNKLKELMPGSVIYIDEMIIERSNGERRKIPSIAFRTI